MTSKFLSFGTIFCLGVNKRRSECERRPRSVVQRGERGRQLGRPLPVRGQTAERCAGATADAEILSHQNAWLINRYVINIMYKRHILTSLFTFTVDILEK